MKPLSYTSLYRLALVFLLPVMLSLTSCEETVDFLNSTEITAEAYVYVQNRSLYNTDVYINGIYAGWLLPGAYNTFTTRTGCITVKTQWSNGFYNTWNPCLAANNTYYCHTSY